MEPPLINVISATNVLKQIATGIHVAQLTSRREKSQTKGPRLLHADDAAMRRKSFAGLCLPCALQRASIAQG